jgi:adenine-specific DNA-methyltransferase
MLALHPSLAAAQAPADKESLQRQITAADKQIDALVYGLYALTPDEIKIVEEATGQA